MKFLAPWYVPALVAAATIPPLLLLYFLKLKRKQQVIPSTLLWRRAVYDLQVNSPFQKLRKNLLLILQLLILLLAIVALSEPIRKNSRTFDQPVVMLLDTSASMATTESDGRTRLDIAKEQANRIINAITTNQRVMVIAFANRARIMAPFTDNHNVLRQAIDAIQQTDEPGRLTEAVALAEAHAAPLGKDVALSQYILFSDGRLPETRDISVQRGTLEFVHIGAASDNIGIVSLDVRRHYEQPESVSVIARVRNFGGSAATRDLSLLVDGQIKDVRTLELKPLATAEALAQQTAETVPTNGSEALATFEMVLPTAGRIEVRLAGHDALATDDLAFAIVPAPKPANVLLVTPGNRYLKQALAAMPLSQSKIISPNEYEQAPDSALLEEDHCQYDLVIFDGHSTSRLPPGSYCFFHGVPLIEGVEAGNPIERSVILDWDDSHPILRHVSVEGFTVISWLNLKLPPQAQPLIEATNGPVLAFLERERRRYLLCAFSLFNDARDQLNTDWVFDESFVVFLYNSLRFLTGQTSAGQQTPLSPGQAFTVSVKPDHSHVRVHRPDGQTDTVTPSSSGLVSYANTNCVGFYTLDTGSAPEQTRAVSLLNDSESLIAPAAEFRIATGELQNSNLTESTHQPLWPIVLIIATVMLFIEWFIYNKRAFV